MSQQDNKPGDLSHADHQFPSCSNADLKPPTPTLAGSETTVEITSPGVPAVNITEVFSLAASALRIGQLVKDEFFTLFEAVSALEIMDSKMDSGHLEPGETLEDEYDVLRDVSPAEVIGIMDQILCHEVAWHMGHPLSRTLFTCLYIERLLWPEPKTLKEAQFQCGHSAASRSPLLHQTLRSYCIATVKACHFVHSMITGEKYYEEEDFNSQTYHRELLPKVPTAEIQNLLDEALSCNATARIPMKMKKAIQIRLNFRRCFLEALEEDAGPMKGRKRCSLSCISLIQEIRDTADLGIPVDAAFSTKIQRFLASSVTPRPMVTTKFADAISHFEALCNDAADIQQILETRTSEDLLTAIWVFMSRVPQPSVYIRAVVQSFLLARETQRVLGKWPSTVFVFSSLAAVGVPNGSLLEAANELVKAPTSPSSQAARILGGFCDKVGPQYLCVFRNVCLNRCRTRRTLCHLVQDWDNLQADAEDIDNSLRTYTEEQPTYYASDQPTFSYPLSSWVYHQKLNLLRHIIQIGFELTIYASDEIAGMYWYLSYTCGTHLSHLDRISFFLQRDVHTQNSLGQRSRPAVMADLERRVAVQKALENLFRVYTRLKATEALSRALHALHTVLLRRAAIKIPPRPYSNDRLRYELRMRPFLTLSVPEPVAFENFQEESLLAELSDGQVLEEAGVRIAEARKFWDAVLKAGWSGEGAETAQREGANKTGKIVEARQNRTTIEGEWSKGVKNVVRACIAASISVAKLKKRLDQRGDLNGIQATIPVGGEKDCWHDCWLVPRLSDVGEQTS